MRKFSIEIYDNSTGCLMTAKWRNEQELRAAKDFLDRQGCFHVAGSSVDNPACYFLDNVEQWDAFHAFRRELSKRKL
jgi:hypothetical protein